MEDVGNTGIVSLARGTDGEMWVEQDSRQFGRPADSHFGRGSARCKIPMWRLKQRGRKDGRKEVNKSSSEKDVRTDSWGDLDLILSSSRKQRDFWSKIPIDADDSSSNCVIMIAATSAKVLLCVGPFEDIHGCGHENLLRIINYPPSSDRQRDSLQETRIYCKLCRCWWRWCHTGRCQVVVWTIQDGSVFRK